MSEIQTLGIIEEIGALVSDRLQVVSYKWLSRNFLVSSNVAKKLLQDFVEKQEHGLEVVYTVAGWLKKSPSTYHIRLVPAPKLEESKQDFDDNCSVQVYSVQACIPKDPAAIWNAEYIQAEELFKQPPTVDNCLRDNRFCGVSNSLVKRNTEGASSAIAAAHNKSAGNPGLVTGRSANQTGSCQQPQQQKLQQSSPKLAAQSNAIPSGTKSEKPSSSDQQKKTSEDKTSLPVTKRKGQSDKSPAAAGGSLTNFWGRASTKNKSTNSSADDKTTVQNINVSADAQISARETLETVSSDDGESDVNFKRTSNGDGGKKRRVILDDSDEDDYENAVNLGSPDLPKGQSIQVLKQKNRTLDIEKSTLNFDEQGECKPKLKENVASVKINHHINKDSAAIKSERLSASEENQGKTADVNTSDTNKAADTARSPPKRRKVLKTRIDERGREVTEVVWEGEETDKEDTNVGKNNTDNLKNPNGHAVKIEDNATTNPVKRPATIKKSPANTVSSHAAAGKTGNKKGASAKDPKQGNILSFFKKV